MTKFIVNKRTDAWKTDFNFFFYNNKKVKGDKFKSKREIHESVRILTTKISQWARENFAVIVKLLFAHGCTLLTVTYTPKSARFLLKKSLVILTANAATLTLLLFLASSCVLHLFHSPILSREHMSPLPCSQLCDFIAQLERYSLQRHRRG